MGEQNSQESGRSYNAHDFRNVLRKSCVMIPQPGTNSTNPKLTTSAGPTHSALTGCSISIGTTKKNLDLFESMSSTEQIKPTSRQQFQTNQRRFQSYVDGFCRFSIICMHIHSRQAMRVQCVTPKSLKVSFIPVCVAASRLLRAGDMEMNPWMRRAYRLEC